MAQANSLNKVLRAALLGVAAFDLILGLLLLGAPKPLAGLLRVPLPSEMFYVWLAGLLQAGLAAAYLVGGLSPARYVGNVVLAAVMRGLMGVLLIFIGMTQGLFVFTMLGIAEVPLGVSHAFYASRLRRG